MTHDYEQMKIQCQLIPESVVSSTGETQMPARVGQPGQPAKLEMPEQAQMLHLSGYWDRFLV